MKKKMIRALWVGLLFLFVAGTAVSAGCQPCNDPSQLICPDEW